MNSVLDYSYTGEIRWVAFAYEPDGWFFCDGRKLPIKNYQMLFSAIGSRYGGADATNFALPNLMGRIPVGAGLLNNHVRTLAETGGQNSVVLKGLPQHGHTGTASVSYQPFVVDLQADLDAQSGVPTVDLVDVPVNGSMLSNTFDAAVAGTPLIYAPAGAGTPVALGGVSLNVQITPGNVVGTVTNAPTGLSHPIDIRQPILGLTPIICWDGTPVIRP